MHNSAEHPEGRRERKRRLLFFKQGTLLLLLLVLGLVAYRRIVAWAEDKDLTRLQILAPAGEVQAEFLVQVVSTPETRARGLMYKKPGELKPHQGMFFVFPDSAERKFWMRNTYLPLDMLFFDEQCVLVSKLENVPVLNDLPRASVGAAKYVLELNAGTAERYKLSAGSRCEFSGALPQTSN